MSIIHCLTRFHPKSKTLLTIVAMISVGLVGFLSYQTKNAAIQISDKIEESNTATIQKIEDIESKVNAQQAILLDSLSQYNYGPLEAEVTSLSSDLGNVKDNLTVLKTSNDEEEKDQIVANIIGELGLLEEKIAALEQAVVELKQQNTDIANIITKNAIDVEALKLDILQYVKDNYGQLPPANTPEAVVEREEAIEILEEAEKIEEVIEEKIDNGIGQEKQAEKENS